MAAIVEHMSQLRPGPDFSFQSHWFYHKDVSQIFEVRNESAVEWLSAFFKEHRHMELWKFLVLPDHENEASFNGMIFKLSKSWTMCNWIAPNKDKSKPGCSPYMSCAWELLRGTCVFRPSDSKIILKLFSTADPTTPQNNWDIIRNNLHRFHNFDWIHHFILMQLKCAMELCSGKMRAERLIIDSARLGSSDDPIAAATIHDNPICYDFSEWKALHKYLGKGKTSNFNANGEFRPLKHADVSGKGGNDAASPLLKRMIGAFYVVCLQDLINTVSKCGCDPKLPTKDKWEAHRDLEMAARSKLYENVIKCQR